MSKRAPPKFRVRIKWRSMVPIAARRLDGIWRYRSEHSIEELEAAGLKHMCDLLADPARRQLGKRMLREIAARLARERTLPLERRAQTAAARSGRRKIGRETAARVDQALSAGSDPAISPRQLRRIRKTAR